MTAGAPRALVQHIDAILQANQIPGCSITLVDRNGPRWSAGVGHADVRTGRPAAPDTVYHLFSGTKLFTAAAVVKLRDRGALTLDDDVTRLLPELPGLRGIRVRHLLSHQSGLADTLRAFLAVWFPPAVAPSAEQALAIYRLRRARSPGTRVEYRNVNYALLGVIVSRASGREYRDLVTSEILAPLGMDAAFTLTEAMRPHAATGYIGRWDPMRLALRVLLPEVSRAVYRGRIGGLMELRDYNLTSAAIGGLVGSVPELSRFVSAQLGDGGEVLSAASTREMQALVARGAAGIESREGMGLGWKHGRASGRVFLNHEGGGAGFTSELRMYPELGLGIALAMNAMRMPATMRAAHRICEAVIGERAALSADARPA